MKSLSVLFLAFFINQNTPVWLTDFNQAKEEAMKNGKMIIINFSGSDWCGPCIRMHKDFFESEEFIKYAEQQLVLVNADFPRLKKNKLSIDQEKKNDQLAEQFNKDGKFPFTILTTANGKVLKEWDGYPKETPAEFVNEIKSIANAGK